MARTISVTRRRANLVDMCLPTRANVASYQVFGSSNFDVATTQFATFPATGFRSKTVPDIGMADSQWRGLTRFLFNPADYTTVLAAIDDTKPFWIQLKQVGVDGTVGAAEGLTLIPPYMGSGYVPLVVKGSAAAGAALANSQEINLPGYAKSITLTNNEAVAGNSLFVAFSPLGPEITIPATTSYANLFGETPTLYIRGGGGAVAFQASFSYPYNMAG